MIINIFEGIFFLIILLSIINLVRIYENEKERKDIQHQEVIKQLSNLTESFSDMKEEILAIRKYK